MPKISKFKVSNYKGIEALDVDVARGGAIFSGGNARGKTTALDAIKACLTAQEISSEAVRLGADRAEILINLDDYTVRRAISRTSPSKLTVERDGMQAKKPTAHLAELLGTVELDAISFFLADDKTRKAMVCAAMPSAITLPQLKKYAPDIEDGFDVSGHGLDVIERARKFFYDERTLANKEVAEAKATAERLAAEALTLAAGVTPGAIVPDVEARAAVAAAERAYNALEDRAGHAVEALSRTAAQRAEIAELRKTAENMAEGLTADVDVAPLVGLVAESTKLIEDLERQLTTARQVRDERQQSLDTARVANADMQRRRAIVAADQQKADAIEAALGAAGVTAPTTEEMAAAQKAIDDARIVLDRAAQQANALAASAAAEAAATTLKTLQAEAAELDTTVKRLANDAPVDLLATSKGIPGLSIAHDKLVFDGKTLDDLSGAEQMKLAVQIAKLANAKSKILLVDGLERLDVDQIEAFVAMATADDWQLFGSRVTGGELVIEALEPAEPPAAAAE